MFRHSFDNRQTLKYETEYGEYFSWGDIRGQNKNGSGSYSFSKDNYRAGKCGSGHNLSGDIPQGNATYDAATANIGSRWKMPTDDQASELTNNTNHIWTTINGVNGRKFASKTDSSKYIFLPAGGWWVNTTFKNTGESGEYWCNKWSSGGIWIIYIASSHINIGLESIRYKGNSVRSVQ